MKICGKEYRWAPRLRARGKIHAAFIGSKLGFCGEDVIRPTFQTEKCFPVGDQHCKRCMKIIANEIAKIQRRVK